LISDLGDTNSLPGSGCGPSKIGASICQRYHSFDVIAAGEQRKLSQDAKYFCCSAISTTPFTVYPGGKDSAKIQSILLTRMREFKKNLRIN